MSQAPHTTIACDVSFEAAHRLPHVAPSHKCFRLHGHSYRVELQLSGPVDPHMGWVMDFDAVQLAFGPLHDQLDHHYLNDVVGLENPTSENIARWIWQRLHGELPLLSAIVVHETCTSRCDYRGASTQLGSP